jgi:hypothetical protein
MLKTSIINTPNKANDHVECWMNIDDDDDDDDDDVVVVLNCTSSLGDAAGGSVVFGTAGVAVECTIWDGGLDGDDTVPFVTFPTTNAGVGINDGAETFNGIDGAAVGIKDVELLGVTMVGGAVDDAMGALVGTMAPTMALQLGESKLAQMGVKDA